jgi:hypothetical protein
MQAWSLSRHVHDPACRLSFADADAAAGMRPNTVCWPQMEPAKTWSAAVSAAWARRAKGKGKDGQGCETHWPGGRGVGGQVEQ